MTKAAKSRARTLKEIKALKKDGLDNAAIAEKLNEKGYKTGTGAEFNARSVSSFVSYAKKNGARVGVARRRSPSKKTKQAPG